MEKIALQFSQAQNIYIIANHNIIQSIIKVRYFVYLLRGGINDLDKFDIILVQNLV